MPYYKVYFLIIFFSLFVSGQTSADFFAVADKCVEEYYKNPNQGIIFTQSALINEESVEHKMILHNILSQAFAIKGDYFQSVKISLEHDYLNENKSHNTFSEIYEQYSLAEQY